MNNLMPISQVAQEYGVDEEQLRYWDRLGILTPIRVGAVRHYGPEELKRLDYIRRLLHDGFRPSEIRLALTMVSFVEGPSVSQTKALDEMVRKAPRGATLEVPFGLNSYNTVYRRAERSLKKNRRKFQIRSKPDKSGLTVKVVE